MSTDWKVYLFCQKGETRKDKSRADTNSYEKNETQFQKFAMIDPDYFDTACLDEGIGIAKTLG